MDALTDRISRPKNRSRAMDAGIGNWHHIAESGVDVQIFLPASFVNARFLHLLSCQSLQFVSFSCLEIGV